MNEKIIAQSKKRSILPVCIAISVLGLIVGFILVFNSPEYQWHSGADYFWKSIVPYYFSMSFLPILVIAVVIYFLVEKSELTVTDKRVYGKAIFGKRVDLPLDSVSAVGTVGLFKGVAISTSSGRIKFLGLANRDEIYKALTDLLIGRQNSSAVKTQEAPTGTADELKKYKELLDSGIITQEEFDAKKKQLLNI